MKSLTSRRLRPLREALDGHPSSQNPAAMESGKRPKSSQYGNFAKGAESGTDLDSQAEQSFFDPEFYLKLYPDVRELFHGDPYEHFVAYGRAEGRLGFPPPFVYNGNFEKLNPLRQNVLVVSHDASTTGAPVLSLNIVLELKNKYNVIVLILKGGSLTDDLQAAADIVVGPFGSQSNIVVPLQIDRLLSRCRILFAIVNSIEARAVLPELARHYIPSVALIHEFASYTRPRNAIEDAIFWASETIFSADIVRDNAIAAFPELSLRLPSVIPQGRCSHALTSPDQSSSKSEETRIQNIFRPAGWPADTPVVLGIGTVHIRKGVDLFVACAARVAQTKRCRFIWIGTGYEPDRDLGFSVYLEDQIARAGLTDCFAFMSETSRIDFAYEKADVLVVSSRLDPLPNVSIDAVSRGLPIVCFDRATGIADILRKNGLASECVAPFLDVERLALRVLAFLENPDLRRSVMSRLKDIGEKTFNMVSYVGQIEKLALDRTQRAVQECIDCATIAENPHLDVGFLVGKARNGTRLEPAIRRFVRSWESGFSLRKPYPGFHPGIYSEDCGVAVMESNPLAHYMRARYPKGRWSYEVIDASVDETVSTSLPTAPVALHLHVFYSELAPIIIERLNMNKVRPDLFISVPSESARNRVELLCKAYDGKVVDIQCVPNRGRDIGAFLTAFGDRILRNYEFVGHFHTKKTAEQTDRSMGEIWFQFLLENLLGGRYKMADIILQKMAADPSIGLVFPDDPFVVGWSKNREPARRLALKMGIPEPLQTYYNFPVGTMFWARSSAIRALIALNLQWSDYPEEPLPSDGTILHAIERLLPFVAEASFFRSALTHVSGVTR
jgi:glycosyltransferase involved in cell wall biosynthesis